jgi:hypothetical protein
LFSKPVTGYLLDCASILSMRRGLLIAPFAAAAALGLAGCGTTGEPTTVPARLAAPPQTAKLEWLEPYTAEAPALVFGVTAFTVTAAGWSANISVENRSDVGWKIVDRGHEDELGFGVMLFPTGDQKDAERLNNSLSLPTIRAATAYRPALPVVLEPGTTWRGTISAPGALAGGLWVRIAFGPFSSVGEPPKGAQSPVNWFTDHTYHLEEVAAVPA